MDWGKAVTARPTAPGLVGTYRTCLQGRQYRLTSQARRARRKSFRRTLRSGRLSVLLALSTLGVRPLGGDEVAIFFHMCPVGACGNLDRFQPRPRLHPPPPTPRRGRFTRVSGLRGLGRASFRRLDDPKRVGFHACPSRTMAGRRSSSAALWLTCANRLDALSLAQRLTSRPSLRWRRGRGLRHLLGRPALRDCDVRPLAFRPTETSLPLEDRLPLRARFGWPRTSHRAGNLACLGEGKTVPRPPLGHAPSGRALARTLLSQ